MAILKWDLLKSTSAILGTNAEYKEQVVHITPHFIGSQYNKCLEARENAQRGVWLMYACYYWVDSVAYSYVTYFAIMHLDSIDVIGK